jgi:hypothetical protein
MALRVTDFSNISPSGDVTDFFEIRMENDANGNPVYVGYCKTPNAGMSVACWYIIKLSYDANQSPTHQQLPNRGVKFTYIWDDRASYF